MYHAPVAACAPMRCIRRRHAGLRFSLYRSFSLYTRVRSTTKTRLYKPAAFSRSTRVETPRGAAQHAPVHIALLLAETLEQWSGKNLLPVDRSLAFTPAQSTVASSRSPMESWSSAPTREDRTRFVTRVATDRRIAESWSSVREHDDRARLAT